MGKVRGAKHLAGLAVLSISLCSYASNSFASTAIDPEQSIQPPASPLTLALSEIGEAEPGDTGEPAVENVEPGLSIDPDSTSEDSFETGVTVDETHPDTGQEVTVSYDMDKLPAPVRRMRELIVEAAVKGDIEGLRPLLGTGITRTQLSITGNDGDPIDYLRENSGDGEGQEVLAILLDIFSAGYVHLDAGEPTEIYLWPYFYAMPLDKLDNRQKVELFRIITAGDYQDMQDFGAYIFYRTGIGPEGDWKFFVAGD
ncbi:hypothetical protein [Hoeflea prorocentri]|uniref:Uncharacterized protein n=1 Tax=Hoeflea prorocentri TaxID=1922333 RepID=A0A9X3UIY5_9HYPH|nr:hypothetical protein [Hoeflea prorocentri]MCY6381446.1 hypothetical protein [Hoeflea prorocentri]MDA5399246.1 hypothetical protein [Hoeflea prorocentri]